MALPEGYTWQHRWNGHGGITATIVTVEEAKRYREQRATTPGQWIAFIAFFLFVMVGIPTLVVIL
jgi:hypothetical protein